jgi:GntP family gluconate:H+ symporter
VQPEPGGLAAQFLQTRALRPPGFGITTFVILLPVLLMLGGTVAGFLIAPGAVRDGLVFLGSPLVALLITTLAALRVFGTSCGFDRATLLRFTDECVGPIAGVLLVVGAGGGFGRVLDEAGVAKAVAEASRALAVSPLVLGWTVAALLRVAVGSATVTITTTASILAPVAAATPGTDVALLVIAMGAGSLIASHVNDGGFWLVKEYFNLTVPETLRSWTVLETILSVTALILVLLLDLVLRTWRT